MQQIDDLGWQAKAAIDRSEMAIANFEAARRQYSEAVRLEQQMEDERATVKHEAIARIMATTNALTGKPHSATSAEAIASADETYASYLLNQRNLVHAKLRTQTAYQSAKLRAKAARTDAELAIAIVKVVAGVV